MRRILPALLLVLIAFAFSLYAGRLAGAASYAHQASGAAVMAMAAPDAADGNCHRDGCHDGSCVNNCCSASTTATLPVPDDGAPRIASTHSLDLPANSWRDGLTLRPVTGPPKFSV